MKTTELFSDIADFRKYVNGLEADTSFSQLTTSIKSAARQVGNIISPDVYDAIAAVYDDYAEGAPAESSLLKTAVAAGAMYQYQIFASVKKNNTDSKLYKYQHEEIKEHYINSYWMAMDDLLEWLDRNPSTGGYDRTKLYRERQDLPVRDAREFNEYYSIDSSSYFYSKVLFLIKNIWKKNLRPMLPAGWTDDAELADDVKRTLCFWTVAEAVIKFDVTELPRSIRYDFNHEYTKGTAMQTREKLYADLMGDVKAWTDIIGNRVRTSAGSTILEHNSNEEGNKFYMI